MKFEVQCLVFGDCEGDTTTRLLLLSEMLWKGKLIGYEHTNRLVQWLSSEIKLRSATMLGMVEHAQVELQTNVRTQVGLAK